MSSPVTLSNFNSIDFNTILNLVMQQAAQPLTLMQTRQTDLAAESNQYNLLATKLGTLETAAAGLSTSSAVATYASTVSDTSAIAVTPGGTQVAGTYNVVVKNLAQAQVTASSSTAPDADTTQVATGGSITIGGVQVTMPVPVTLQGLADRINATASMPVSAAVVQTAPGAFRLVLTSRNTGLASGFAVTNNLTGGTGVAFANPNTLEAGDASVTVNNLAIASASNTLESAIPGTTMTLFHADLNKTVTVSVAADDSALVTNVKSFVSAYNDLIAFISDQSKAAASGQTGTLAHEALVREARIALRSAIGGTYGSGTSSHLAEVGVGFNHTGQLTLNSADLASALQHDRSSVVTLFTGTATTGAFTNGAFGTLQGAIDSFTQAGGLISSAQTQLTAQSARLTNQINDLQARLAIQRATLQQQFSAADAAMTTLKSQSGTLAGLSSNQGANSFVTNG